MTEIVLRRTHWQQMLEDCRSRLPLEACGLVSGKDGKSTRVYPAENALQSPVRYRLEPKQQLQILNEIEESGCDLLAIYHSHPNGPEGPSETDLAEAAYPDAVYLIWSNVDSKWSCRAYQIVDGVSREVEIVLAE